MLKKRSLIVAGHSTSVTLEEEFWAELKRIAARRGQSINQMAAQIDTDRAGNLSSALRVFVLHHMLDEAGRTPPVAAGESAHNEPRAAPDGRRPNGD